MKLDRNRIFSFMLAAVFALVLAGCGGGGSTATPPPDPTPVPDTRLSDAQKAAADAATAANTAYEAAKAAVMGQDDNMSAEPGSYAIAVNARDRAMAAATAAQAASTAAAAATDVAAAEAQRDIALAKQGEAEAEQANAEMYAGMVQTAQDAIDAEAQRVVDVGAARSAAMASYEAADGDATKAEAAADEAEATAPNSPGASAARMAATAARNAANAAKTALDAIMDDMTKVEADMKATDAATAAEAANSSYMTAKAENDDIQTSAATVAEQQRVRDVADATTAAEKAAMATRASATAARTNATNARNAANAAKASYEMAMAARTDMANAQAQYMAADAAATVAENAATAAEMAADAAEAAHMGIDAAGSGVDAQAAQATAEMKQSDAEGNAETASTEYMTAKTAMEDAAMYAGTIVLGLFKTANPADDPETKDNASTTDVVENNENADRVEAVTTALSEAAAVAHSTGSQHSTDATPASGISVAWPADTPDDPDTEFVDESSTGTRGFTVSADGENFVPDNLTADTPTATSTPLTALGDFAGVELAREQVTGANVYVHIYSDIEQAEAATPEMTVEFDRVVLSGQQVGPLSRITLPANAAVTNGAFTAAYDHDDDGEDPITSASFSCGSGDCSVAFTDNEVTQLGSGWRVSGVRDAGTRTIAAVAEMADADYLTFGVWLSAQDTTGVNNADVEVGAFSAGSSAYTLANSLTGSATYEGPAVGIKSQGGEVSHVDGTATLTANFGAIDTEAERTGTPADTTPGSISGMVDIGGMTVHLGEDSDVSNGISGMTRAGAVVNKDDGTATYMYTGMWGGSFYGATANDPDTADDESITAPLGVAGTFGVTGGEDDAAMSLIGAFGARKK